MLHMTMVYMHSWHAYGHGILPLSYMTLLIINTIDIWHAWCYISIKGTLVLHKLLLL